ncbi:MAG: hypothetical protein KGS72_04810 [Cyanobacteria bacterium REEB67]|nr:hypothetical protein [Cyanobacteria bacterium REEB67]
MMKNDNPPHEAEALNPYGDQIKNVREGFGSDVSSQRLTPFEEEILARAENMQARQRHPLVALDLFSGYCAANARRLSELGFKAHAVDFAPADPAIAAIVDKPNHSGGVLHYQEVDLRQFDPSIFDGKLDLATCQRGLHFLRYNEARHLIVELTKQLTKGARMYFSIGAVDCAVGPGYKHAERPVADRWHPLEPDLGGPIHVTEPLCLYKDEDIVSLFAGLPGTLLRVERDDFGLFVVEFAKD